MRTVGHEKYYTKSEVVSTCLNTLNLGPFSVVIEPSAGSGAFSNRIPNCLAYDIEPESVDIIRQDFFTLDTSRFTEKVIVVGNPPFGRNSCLAKKFIKKSCEFADTIAFILPASFKKESMQRAFKPEFHLRDSIDLPKNSFELNDKDYHVPCVFQVWDKKNTQRLPTPMPVPLNYKFTKDRTKANLAFQRVGGNAGTFKTNTVGLSIQSHYFMVMETIPKDLSFTWDTNNTVGPKSISKKELVLALNARNQGP